MSYFADQMVGMIQDMQEHLAEREAAAQAQRNARIRAQREAQRAAKAKFELDAPEYRVHDQAAGLTAELDALFVELRRVDPKNRLLHDNEQLQAIYQAGIKTYVRQGRKNLAHAKVVELGIFKVDRDRRKVTEAAYQNAVKALGLHGKSA